jgi:thioredoxin 2
MSREPKYNRVMSEARTDESGVIVTCGFCGQQNRIAFARLDRAPRCGKCHKDLPKLDAPVDVSSTSSFNALVADSPVPVLVDFWAPWCGPCLAVAPEIARVASNESGRLVVAKVNTEELQDLAARFNIRSIPTMALFAGGREIGRTMGARPAPGIMAFVNETLQQV